MVDVTRFAEGLAAIPEPEFTVKRVARYIVEQPVDPESLAPYVRYEPTHYTRNLIYKGALFELIAICWDVGQASQIHNHHNQNCWMAVPIGRLAVQNYAMSAIDATTGSCELAPTGRVVMEPGRPSFVDPAEPIHAVLNLPEWRARATSLHVYSRPYDRCLIYSIEQKRYWEVPLFYDSIGGQPVPS